MPATETAKHAIHVAIQAAETDARLILAERTLAQWLTSVSRHWSNVARPLSLGTLRDLRSAYACDRYSELVNAPAPVVAGERLVDKYIDHAVRQVLSQELGHNRIDVVAAYVGSSR